MKIIIKYVGLILIIIGCLSIVAFIDIGDDAFGIIPTTGFLGYKVIEYAYPPPITETLIPYPPPKKPSPNTSTPTTTTRPTSTLTSTATKIPTLGTPRATPDIGIIIATGCVGWCPYITATYSNP